MNTAKQINEKLDAILAIRSEIKRMNTELSGDEPLKNIQTGESVNKEEALKGRRGNDRQNQIRIK